MLYVGKSAARLCCLFLHNSLHSYNNNYKAKSELPMYILANLLLRNVCSVYYEIHAIFWIAKCISSQGTALFVTVLLFGQQHVLILFLLKRVIDCIVIDKYTVKFADLSQDATTQSC